VQWDASPEAGFTTGVPWIAVNPDYAEVNAAGQDGVAGSVFEHYRQLIDLRHTDPVVTDGEFELLLAEHPAIWAFLRRGRAADLLVTANFSGNPVSATLPLEAGWADAAIVLTSHPRRSPPQPPELALTPWESVIWRRKR
jgi:oligo-1,6-glucosidase